jgi:molybdopterin-binding protein
MMTSSIRVSLGTAARSMRSTRQAANAAPITASSMSLRTPAVRRLALSRSARNQIPARVTSINAGEAIANVELDAGGVRLVASITVEAVRQLGLAEGSNVTAVIKASDVIVATSD